MKTKQILAIAAAIIVGVVAIIVIMYYAVMHFDNRNPIIVTPTVVQPTVQPTPASPAELPTWQNLKMGDVATIPGKATAQLIKVERKYGFVNIDVRVCNKSGATKTITAAPWTVTDGDNGYDVIQTPAAHSPTYPTQDGLRTLTGHCIAGWISYPDAKADTVRYDLDTGETITWSVK